MKRIIATGLAAVSMLAVAPAARAEALTREQGAWQRVTNDCLRYTGCRSITLNQVATDGLCRRYTFTFHTTYYGWVSGWYGPFCVPPYQF